MPLSKTPGLWIVVLSLGIASCGKDLPPPPPPPPQVGVVTLKAEPATLLTELPGRITAVESSEVRPQVSGVLQRRLFEEGSMVQARQGLFQGNDAPNRAALPAAPAALAHAQATIKASQLQAERYRNLLAVHSSRRHSH